MNNSRKVATCVGACGWAMYKLSTAVGQIIEQLVTTFDDDLVCHSRSEGHGLAPTKTHTPALQVHVQGTTI